MKIENLKFDHRGLIPVIAQDKSSHEILMFAFANIEAIQKTVESNRAHYFSRSRQKIWLKGEESGHFQFVDSIWTDCDGDVLIYRIFQLGGISCHTGSRSCFFRKLVSKSDFADEENSNVISHEHQDFLHRLEEVIVDRKRKGAQDQNFKSYVCELERKGLDFILKKLLEECGEYLLASKCDSQSSKIYEASDLIFHLLVSLNHQGISYNEIKSELLSRFGRSGIDEKLSRKSEK